MNFKKSYLIPLVISIFLISIIAYQVYGLNKTPTLIKLSSLPLDEGQFYEINTTPNYISLYTNNRPNCAGLAINIHLNNRTMTSNERKAFAMGFGSGINMYQDSNLSITLDGRCFEDNISRTKTYLGAWDFPSESDCIDERNCFVRYK